jgi:hypothetical protein
MDRYGLIVERVVARYLFKLSVVVILLLVVGISSCEPPSGVIAEKEILIVDAGQTVQNEEAAMSLVSQKLAPINQADLIRIPGEINQATLVKMSARDCKHGGEPAFLVSLDYSVGTDTGKLNVVVTSEGKIYGSARADSSLPSSSQ